MKLQKLIQYLMLASVLAGIAVVWWACEFERTIDNVGLSAPLDVPLAQILKELASSRTQQEAEKAITHLLEKTGVGLPVKGSKYNEYYLPGEFVARMAQNHLLYLNGGDSTDWALAFELEKLVSEGQWAAPINFTQAVARLQYQANAALAEPESPNHALLVAMLARGTTLPESIAAPAPADLISPVQEFLFEAWLNAEFGDLITLQKPKGTLEFNFILADCENDGDADKYKETLKVPWTNKTTKVCLQEVRERWKMDYKQCSKDYKDCRKIKSKILCCQELQACLIAARDKALPDIDDCLAGHDQGGGN